MTLKTMMLGTCVMAMAVPVGAQQGSPVPAVVVPRIEMPRDAGPLQPPRDTSARTPDAAAIGTARVRGRVVSADSGLPLRRATVTATPTRPPEMQRGGVFVPPRRFSARTDDEGNFVITELLAGDYNVMANRQGYASQGYGQQRPGTPARRVSVTDGADVGPLNFALTRAGVITGRVVDEEGEPAERVQVRVVRHLRIGGQLRYAPVSMGSTTDDLGHYRLYGLVPGEYLVVAEPGDRSFFMNAQAVQNVSVDTIPTYGPGTANPAEAQKVQVQAGVETAMDIQLVAARVATIRGRVVTSKGEAMVGGFVRLLASTTGLDTLGGRSSQMRGDGHFEIPSVPPGSYTLTVQPMMRGGPDQMPADTEGANEPITVDGSDLDLLVRTTPGSTASGRVVLEGADPAVLKTRELRVQAMPVGPFVNVFFGPPGRGVITPELTFDVVGLRGLQMLTVPLLPEDWWVKDVRLDGQSVYEGHDFASGRAFTGVEIVISGRPTGIQGGVAASSGSTAGDYAVVLFPAEEDRWERIGPGQMGPRAVRPGNDGTFRIANVRPGEYYVLAMPVDQADMTELSDPDRLRELAARARTVTVEDGAMARVSLTLVSR